MFCRDLSAFLSPLLFYQGVVLPVSFSQTTGYLWQVKHIPPLTFAYLNLFTFCVKLMGCHSADESAKSRTPLSIQIQTWNLFKNCNQAVEAWSLRLNYLGVLPNSELDIFVQTYMPKQSRIWLCQIFQCRWHTSKL